MGQTSTVVPTIVGTPFNNRACEIFQRSGGRSIALLSTRSFQHPSSQSNPFANTTVLEEICDKMQVLLIGLINMIFLSHLSYLVVERKGLALKSRSFWALISGLMISLYLTIWYSMNFLAPWPGN